MRQFKQSIPFFLDGKKKRGATPEKFPINLLVSCEICSEYDNGKRIDMLIKETFSSLGIGGDRLFLFSSNQGLSLQSPFYIVVANIKAAGSQYAFVDDSSDIPFPNFLRDYDRHGVSGVILGRPMPKNAPSNLNLERALFIYNISGRNALVINEPNSFSSLYKL